MYATRNFSFCESTTTAKVIYGGYPPKFHFSRKTKVATSLSNRKLSVEMYKNEILACGVSLGLRTLFLSGQKNYFFIASIYLRVISKLLQ